MNILCFVVVVVGAVAAPTCSFGLEHFLSRTNKKKLYLLVGSMCNCAEPHHSVTSTLAKNQQENSTVFHVFV